MRPWPWWVEVVTPGSEAAVIGGAGAMRGTLRGVPERIGRYELLSELGRGSMGQVFLALDPNIQRNVALKIFLPALRVGVREERELRQRFIQEARTAGRLQHPGVVTVFDAGTDPESGLSYIAMEWVDGPSLQDLLDEGVPLPFHQALSITEQVALALDAAHSEGFVHRDIKPANILLDAEGRAQVTDFGIAKLASLSFTATGWIPGSPLYMAPEQIRNERVDGRSDLYSLGVVLYQCLTGTVPFDGDSLASLTYMILEIDPRPPQSINRTIPDDLAAIVQRTLDKSPERRFQTGLQLARALRALGAEVASGPRAIPVSSPLPRERPPALVGADAATPTAQGTMLLAVDLDRAAAADGPGEAVGERGGAAWMGGRRSRVWAAVLGVLAVGLCLALLRPWVFGASSGPSPEVVTWDVRPGPAGGEEPLAADSGFAPVDSGGDPGGPPAGDSPESASSEEPRTSQPATASVSVANRNQGAPPAIGSDKAVASQKRAVLEVLYRNRLKDASVSIWIDDARVWSEEVTGPKSWIKRAVGRIVLARVPVNAGRHVIDVRVIGAEGKVDLVRRITGEFEAGETRRLKAVYVPPKMLRIFWKDHEDA